MADAPTKLQKIIEYEKKYHKIYFGYYKNIAGTGPKHNGFLLFIDNKNYYCPLNMTSPCPTSLLPVVGHIYVL